MPRMWQLYSVVWILYVLVVSFSTQANSIMQGNFQFYKLLIGFVSALPAALLLSMIWPLSAYFERTQASIGKILTVHGSGALVFGILWHLWNNEFLRWLGGLPRQPLVWYV